MVTRHRKSLNLSLEVDMQDEDNKPTAENGMLHMPRYGWTIEH
jgi:hypothetical protein